MSTASMAAAVSISLRIASVHGSAPKMPTSRLVLRRIDALFDQRLDQDLHVGRRHHDDLRLQVGDELKLLLGLAARHWDHRAAGPLGAVVRTQTAGEEAVAVGHVHHVAGPAAGGADRARHQVGPGVDVAQRVAHDGRLAGRSRRRVQARDALLRHGEQAERIVVAQVGFDREGEQAQVGQRFQIRRMNAPRVEGLLVVRHAVVGVLQAPLQALQLQCLQLVAAGALDRLELARGRLLHRHDDFSSVPGNTLRPAKLCDLPRTRATGAPCWLMTSMS